MHGNGSGSRTNRKGQGRAGEALSQDSQQPLSSPTWSVSPGGTLRRAASPGGQVLRSGCAWGGTFSCRPKGPPKTSVPGAGGLGEGGRPRISPGLLAGPSGAAPFLLGFLGRCGDSRQKAFLDTKPGDPRALACASGETCGSHIHACSCRTVPRRKLGGRRAVRQAAPSRPREQTWVF